MYFVQVSRLLPDLIRSLANGPYCTCTDTQFEEFCNATRCGAEPEDRLRGHQRRCIEIS